VVTATQLLALGGAVLAAVLLWQFAPVAWRALRSWSSYRAGLACYEKGDMAGAEAAWREAVDRFQLNVSARLGLGKLLARRGDAPGAIEQYEEALRTKPGYVKAHMNLANVLLSQRRFDDALEHYELAAAAGVHRAQKMIGMIHHRHHGDRKRALAAYTRYLYEVGPDPEVERWLKELPPGDS